MTSSILGIQMKAFTYLIKNNVNGKWYYGVRYAKNCKITDIFTEYFTSSVPVKTDIELYGISAFTWEIRQIFEDVQSALKWECKVLKRMKVIYDDNCYNKHHHMGFTVNYGDQNSSRRPEVREKLRDAALRRPKLSDDMLLEIRYNKARHKIYQAFRGGNLQADKKRKLTYRNWIVLLEIHKPNCRRMISLLKGLLIEISMIPKKPYPTTRKHAIRSPEESIRISALSAKKRIGSTWFTSPDLLQLMLVRAGDPPAPTGWIRGMKTTQKVEKNRISSTGRRHTSDTKDKMKSKGKMYYTSPDLKELVVVYDEKDAPDGWLRGNKLKLRNDKISTYLNNVRYKNAKNKID